MKRHVSFWVEWEQQTCQLLRWNHPWVRWQVDVLAHEMCKFSGRPLESIKMIPCDLGPSSDNIKDHVPGNFHSLVDASTFICLFSHNRCSAELSSAQFVKDHCHLKKKFGRWWLQSICTFKIADIWRELLIAPPKKNTISTLKQSMKVSRDFQLTWRTSRLFWWSCIHCEI